MEHLAEQSYHVQSTVGVVFDEKVVPDHLRITAGSELEGRHHEFTIEADRVYIAEYGMRFYRMGIVFFIMVHSAYDSIRLIRSDKLLKKMEAPDEHSHDIPMEDIGAGGPA